MIKHFDLKRAIRMFGYKKVYTMILISCMTLMLAGCRAAQSTEADLVQENEITVEDTETADGKEQTAEKAQQLAEQKKRTTRKEPQSDTQHIYGVNGQSEEQEQEEESTVEIYSSYPSVTEGLLPVAVTSESELCVDLSFNPELWRLVENNRKEYDRQCQVNLKNFSTTEYIQRADSYAYSYLNVALTDFGEYKRYAGFNYHVESGKALTLEDIVKDKDALIAALAEQITVAYGASLPMSAEDLARSLCESKSAWNIGYQGLTFYENESVIGGDASQCFSVLVTFLAYPNLFREECMQIPEKYAVAESDLCPFMYDLNEDGTAEKIDIWSITGDKGLEKLVVMAGDVSKEIDTTSASDKVDEGLSYDNLRCHILHLGDGKNFIYLHTKYWLDDLYYGVCLSASDSEIVVLNDEAGIGIEDHPLIDPLNIVYLHSDWILSNTVGFFSSIACGQIDENGQFHRKEGIEYYPPDDTLQCETTTAFLADQIDKEDVNVVIAEQDLVPSKRILRPYRTDGETFIDFIDETDGKIYRGIVEVQWKKGEGIEIRINGSLVNV